MLSLSLPFKGGGRLVATARIWTGPALAGLFGVAVTTLVPFAVESPLARWILTSTLAFERVLPMIGLGALFGLVGPRVLAAALLLFALGIIAGLMGEDWLLRWLDAVPQAVSHEFLAGPISYFAVGAALASGTHWRPVWTPLSGFLCGAMLGLVVRLTDPTLHEPAYTWTPVLIAFWIILAISSTVRAFEQAWFPVFGRILGSWLLAIGLLYGGAVFVPKRQPPPIPPRPTPAPELGQRYPDIDLFPYEPGPDGLPGDPRGAPQ